MPRLIDCSDRSYSHDGIDFSFSFFLSSLALVYPGVGLDSGLGFWLVLFGGQGWLAIPLRIFSFTFRLFSYFFVPVMASLASLLGQTVLLR